MQNSASTDATQLPDRRRLLLVIADGEHARFVRPTPSGGLRTERFLDSRAAHQRAADLTTDRPGAAFHSHSSAHHALAPRHDPKALEKGQFAEMLAAELNGGSTRDEFRELVLVAPAHILRSVRDALDSQVTTRITGMLQRDLVKVPDDQLEPHLKQWLKPFGHPH